MCINDCVVMLGIASLEVRISRREERYEKCSSYAQPMVDVEWHNHNVQLNIAEVHDAH